MTNNTTILLVDDDVEFVESNKDLLEAHNYSVLTANDGKTGLDIARKQQPDLMVLDVMMTTKTEGFDVARTIAEDDQLRTIPVILLTGIRRELKLPYTFDPDENWLPVSTVLEKPVDPAKLVATIEKLLQKARNQ